MKRPKMPVRTTTRSEAAVAVASWLFDWNAAWKAMTTGLMKPTNMWKSSQPRMEPKDASARERLRTG